MSKALGRISNPKDIVNKEYADTKQAKVSGAVENNFASFDSNGNTKDSGVGKVIASLLSIVKSVSSSSSDTSIPTAKAVWNAISSAISGLSIPTMLSQLTGDSTHRTVTDTEKSTWDGKYSKPSTGIPKTDLASAVQTSLDNADNSVQKVTSVDNTIARYDGTTGQIQGSTAVITDDGRLGLKNDVLESELTEILGDISL